MLIDVRSRIDFMNYHIKDSINIPYEFFFDEFKTSEYNLNTEINLICKNGKKSEAIKNILEEKGFKNVKNLGSVFNYSGGK